MATISDLADFILFDLDTPSGVSNGTISYWIENSVGNLNTYLGASHTVENFEITPGLNIMETGIMNQMYKIKYYNTVASNNLGASSYDWSELKEGDSSIRKVSKNEIAKNYLQLAKQEKESLNESIRYYRTNAATPTSIVSRVSTYLNIYGYNNSNNGGYNNDLPNTYRSDVV